MGENVWFALRMMHTVCAIRMSTVSMLYMHICIYMSVCLFACYLFTRWIHCWGTHRQRARQKSNRKRGRGMSKERDAVVVVVVEEKQKRREEKRRERRQQVSAWESRVKYLVLVKRRRKRTRRTRLQFTVNRSRVTGHRSQFTHSVRSFVQPEQLLPFWA